VQVLIVEEDMRSKRLKHFVLADAPEEKGFIDTNIPFSESTYNSLVGRAVPRSNKSGAN
jgi:hypothetical protein